MIDLDKLEIKVDEMIDNITKKDFEDWQESDKKRAMKTLVIHPKDYTTDFLSVIYENENFTVINDMNVSKRYLKEQIKNHDRIIMLGHGTNQGLLGNRAFVIDSDWVYLLREKECVYIWCNADEFVNKYKLKGIYSGMIISEYEEALMYNIESNQTHVDESNKLFTEVIKHNLNNPKIVEAYKIEYCNDNNPIIMFNRDNFYER